MRAALGAGLALVHGVDGERDVAVDRQPRHQRVGLEDDAALRPRPGDRPCPRILTVPLSGAMSPAMAEISVVLPDAGEADDGDELALLRP